MSIDFPGTPEPCLDQSKIGKLIERFEHVEGFRLVRKSESEVGLASTTTDESTTETTTITLAPDEIYPGFHAASRDERERLLGIAQEFLLESSVGCELEEQ